MARKRKGNRINGWLNLHKPYDMTSTDAVAAVRRLLRQQKVGHGGTLDPLATGVLPIALGEATKTISYCQDRLKKYTFTIRWGEFRTTDDAEGEVTETSSVRPTAEEIKLALPEFTGDIAQIPPQFSAIKINGQRAYDLARSGETVKLKPRTVYIEQLELLDATGEEARFFCLSGKGTYIRALARDLAKALGTAGYMSALQRDSVGALAIENAISLEKLEEIAHSARLDEVLLPVETVLDDIPALALNEQEAARLKNGQKLLFFARPDMDRLLRAGLHTDEDGIETALASCHGKPVALVDVEGVEIRPKKVLNL